MEFRQVYKGDKTLMYKLIYKNNTQNIRAKIIENEIQVVAPNFLTISQVDDFIIRHFDALYETRNKMIDNCLIDLKANFISLFNKKYQIKIQNIASGREKYQILSNNVYLFLKNEENKQKMIIKIYHDLGSDYIINRAKLMARKLKYQVPGGFATKWYNSKWGQCNVNIAKITLADQLIMFNDDIIDYVIIHELCHLSEPNHSPKFWALVEQYFPNYKWAKEKLGFKC